jgi:hypothetical protein
MAMRLGMIAAALMGVAGLAAPAHAVDFLGIPLWESYPSQYAYPPSGYTYAPPPAYNYDPYTGRYYRY